MEITYAEFQWASSTGYHNHRSHTKNYSWCSLSSVTPLSSWFIMDSSTSYNKGIKYTWMWVILNYSVHREVLYLIKNRSNAIITHLKWCTTLGIQICNVCFFRESITTKGRGIINLSPLRTAYEVSCWIKLCSQIQNIDCAFCHNQGVNFKICEVQFCI